MERLTGALIGVARAARDNEARLIDETLQLITQGLLCTEASGELIQKLHAEKARLAPDCAECGHPCGKTADFDMAELLLDDAEVRVLKEEVLTLLRHAAGTVSDAVFFCDGLNLIGDVWNAERLRKKVAELKMHVSDKMVK